MSEASSVCVCWNRFFRTHHQLLPLVHCVARCVAANATARCVADPRQNQLMASNPELLGLALAQSGAYMAQVVRTRMCICVCRRA